MMNPQRQYFFTLAGFCSVILLCSLLLAAVNISHWHATGEFQTLQGRVFFYLFLWGGSLLLFSGGAFALVSIPFLFGHRMFRTPLLVGVLSGVVGVALAGIGVAGQFGRRFALPFPVAAVLPGLLAALFVLPVAFLFSRRTPAPRADA